MNGRTALLLAATLALGAVTARALAEVGYSGILAAGLGSWGAGQILADLVVACALAMVWMVDDARRLGLNPWPWVVLTVLAGSFGPLAYLLHRERSRRCAAARSMANS